MSKKTFPRSYHKVAAHGAKKVISHALLRILNDEGLGEDLDQEIHLTALTSERRGEDTRDTVNRAQRNIYRFLRNYGFRRDGRGYEKKSY